MDIKRFLELPVDIRAAVYYHLDGHFTNVTPPTASPFFDGQDVLRALKGPKVKRTKSQKRILRNLYPIFRSYLKVLDHDPELVQKWLEYSLWLRYDAIVLDCLRMNHAYEGSLIGVVDWIYLGSKLRIGYFDKSRMLEVWYTRQEYEYWIIDGDTVGEYEPRLSYARLDMSNLKPSHVGKVLDLLEKKDLFRVVSEVYLKESENATEFEYGYIKKEEEQETDDNLVAPVDVSVHSGSPSSPSFRHASGISPSDSLTEPTRKKRRVKTVLGPVKQSKFIEPMVSEVVQKQLDMKILKKIGTSGDILYNCLVNRHGLRTRQPLAIPAMVRRKVTEIEVSHVSDTTIYGFIDLTNFENLRQVHLGDIGFVDLNSLIVPKTCKSLSISKVGRLVWFNTLENLEKLGFEKKNTTTLCANTDDPCSDLNKCKHRKLLLLRNASNFYTSQKLSQFEAEIWSAFESLNYIKIEHIGSLEKSEIVVTKMLYFNNRIRIFSCNNINSIIVI